MSEVSRSNRSSWIDPTVDSSVDMLLKAAVSVILYMMIVIEIPNIVSAMIYGSPSTSSSAMGMIGRVAGKLGP